MSAANINIIESNLLDRSQQDKKSWNDRFFVVLMEKIHESLKKQDSDSALILVTK
jgi:hypothetical protein